MLSFFLGLSGDKGDDSSIYNKIIMAHLKRMDRLVFLRNNTISAPELADFLLHLFRLGLAWYTICIYHLAFSAFLEPHCLHSVSNHPII